MRDAIVMLAVMFVVLTGGRPDATWSWAQPAAHRDGFPFLTSDSLRIARDIGPQAGLRMEIEERRGDSSGRLSEHKNRLQILLGQDFASVRDGETMTVYDFALDRLLSHHIGGRYFFNSSLYASVARRELQMRNREYLRAFIKRAGGTMSAGSSRAWDEMELGVRGRSGEPAKIVYTREAGPHMYHLDGAPVVTMTYTEGPQPDAVVAQFYRLIRHLWTLHPDIVAQMRQIDGLPAEIHFLGAPEGVASATPARQWRVIDMRPDEVVFPVPGGLVVTPTAAELGLIGPALSAAYAAAGASPDAPKRASLEALHQDAQSFAAQEDWLAAGLTWNIAWQQYGDDLAPCLSESQTDICRDFPGQFRRALEVDDRFRSLMSDLSHAPEDLEGFFRAILNLDLGDDQPYGYWRHVTLALILKFAGNSTEIWDTTGLEDQSLDALDHIAHVIAINPWMANLYKDIGDILLIRLEANLAWTFFDLGRALPGSGVSNLTEISAFERDLKATKPEFFD